jgi:hypothetical protein
VNDQSGIGQAERIEQMPLALRHGTVVTPASSSRGARQSRPTAILGEPAAPVEISLEAVEVT